MSSGTVNTMNATVYCTVPRLTKAVVCPLCRSGRDAWDLNAQTFGAGLFEKEMFSIYQCRSCGIGITDPVPTEDESRLLYSERASCDFHVDDSSIASRLKGLAADRDVRAFIGRAKLSLPAPKMLDYACGNGAFSLALRRAFPEGAVWATDYHVGAPSMLKGSDVNYVDYGRLPAQGPFDVILCRHVLEHTYDPVGFLRNVGDLMLPGGVLVIEVPNLKAPLGRVFGKYWDGNYVPYHPIHFSAAALAQAAANAGFTPESAGGCEMPKIGRSLRNVVGCEYNFLFFAVGMLLHPFQIGAQALTGEATCLRLWARKKGK
jgi:SAM-dependent methyltransferase